jgi:membrane protein
MKIKMRDQLQAQSEKDFRFKKPIASALSTLIASIKMFVQHDMANYAAALAYHFLFALFPFIIFLLALLGFLDLTQIYDWMKGQAQLILPPPAMAQLDRVVSELQLQQKGLVSLGAATALWVASGGTRALMKALNVAYGATESRPLWKRIPLSIFFTLGLAVMVIAATTLLSVGPRALGWISSLIGLHGAFVFVWTIVRWPVALLLLTTAVASVYYVAPNVSHRFHLLSPGSILSILVWIAASFMFSYYVENFASYGMMYGSIGAIIVLLLYLYLSAAALLFGAEVNGVIARKRHSEC